MQRRPRGTPLALCSTTLTEVIARPSARTFGYGPMTRASSGVRRQLVDERAVADLALRDRVPDADDAVAADVVDRDLRKRRQQSDDGLAHGEVRLEPVGDRGLDGHVRTIRPLRTVRQPSGWTGTDLRLASRDQPVVARRISRLRKLGWNGRRQFGDLGEEVLIRGQERRQILVAAIRREKQEEESRACAA